MQFKQAAGSDLQTIFDLTRRSIRGSYPACYPEEVVAFFEMLHSEERIAADLQQYPHWILYDGGQPVGTGCVKGSQICRVYLPPECQGRGYGAAIMDHLEAQVAMQYPAAQLSPSLLAESFYKKRGYRTVQHELCRLPGGAELAHDVMEKDLH